MEVSEKRIAANRANALKSTGPKDTTKTRFNGVKHGLTAMHALLPWEHTGDLQAMLESFESRFAPTDNFERLLVKQAAEAFWRLERSLRLEASMFEAIAAAEIEASGFKATELHAGHLEGISFMQGQEMFEKYRRYDAHLQRAFDKAMARLAEMASLRKKNAEPLPPAAPVEQSVNTTLKECVAKVPFPRRRTVRVLGEHLIHPEPVLKQAS